MLNTQIYCYKNNLTDQNQPDANYPAFENFFFTVGQMHSGPGFGGNINGVNDGDYCNGWIGFNLSSLPAGAVIVSATLYVSMFAAVSDVNYSTLSFSLQRSSSDSWTENSITWNNAPSTSYETATYSNNPLPETVNFNVTSDVQAAFATLGKEVSWKMDLTGGEDSTWGGNFRSRTNTSSSDAPYLDIQYTLPTVGALFFGSD